LGFVKLHIVSPKASVLELQKLNVTSAVPVDGFRYDNAFPPNQRGECTDFIWSCAEPTRLCISYQHKAQWHPRVPADNEFKKQFVIRNYPIWLVD
jgi:hypothetical protein